MTDPTTAVATRDEPTLTPFEVIERVLTAGDLGKMDPADRLAFYWRTCESLGLNPLTRPFDFIRDDKGNIIMYARKDATDQLRRINGVSIVSLRREVDQSLGLLTVYASARDDHGRVDESSGVVSTKGLAGTALANAVMKAETKAKRRVTLSLVGLGFLDESEVDASDRVDIDPETGVIADRPPTPTLLEQVQAQQEAMAAPPGDEVPVRDAGLDGPADGPQPAEIVEVAADAPADADAQPDAPSAPVVAEGQLPATLTQQEFFDQLDAAGIARQAAADRARQMFPGSGARKPLDDAQRAQLLAALLEA